MSDLYIHRVKSIQVEDMRSLGEGRGYCVPIEIKHENHRGASFRTTIDLFSHNIENLIIKHEEE